MIIKSVAYQDLYKHHPTFPFSEYMMTLSVVAIARGTFAGPSGMGRAGFPSRDLGFLQFCRIGPGPGPVHCAGAR